MRQCRRISPIALAATLLGGPAIAPPLAAAADVQVRRILSIPASRSQLMVQQTPIDTHGGRVYTANVEPGPNGDSDDATLRTMLRQGSPRGNGSFDWQAVNVEARTAADPYHTAPAVGIDRGGHVHVAYNMHNLPWQYKRSSRPHDIRSLEFRGQAISRAEIERMIFDNKTDFPTLGKAEIPGNQITYPAFARDRAGELHLSYRFAARPARAFADRTMSGGIARYDLAGQSWTAVGGNEVLAADDFAPHPDAPDEVRPFAARQGWTVYNPDLSFDSGNRLHVQFFWRSGTAGAELSRPCHLVLRPDGRFVDAGGQVRTPPIRPEQCGNMGYPNSQQFNSIGMTAISGDGVPHVVLSPKGGSRKILRLDGASWVREEAPYAATELFFDADDTLWALASGFRLLRRPSGSTSWELVHSTEGGEDCYPRAVVDEGGTTAYIHTHSCDGTRVNVYSVALAPARNCIARRNGRRRVRRVVAVTRAARRRCRPS